MFRTYLPALLLLAVSLVSAQEINNALGPGRPASAGTIFDEIEDPAERVAFREVWDTSEPATQRHLAIRFVDRYPRSVLLREAYELAARAYVAEGNLTAGQYWANRSLRLMPENPFLLVMSADIASREGQPDLAVTRARDAIRHLEQARAPSPIPPQQWPQVRNELLATANGVLGRIAAAKGDYRDAEPWMIAAVRLNPGDLEAIYVLGLVWMELHQDEEAAPALAHVVRGNGPWSATASRFLRVLFERRAGGSGLSFAEYTASLKWSPPVLTVPAPAPVVPPRYAGSAACRDCHTRVYQSWQTTGMAKMFRPYRAGDVIGDFSGRHTVSDSARPITDGNRHFIEIREGTSERWTRYPVDFIIGSKWQQAYATTLPDSRLLVFPIQYSRVHSSWSNYWKIVDGPGSARTDISRFHEIPEGAIYQNSCAPCHTSQLKFQQVPAKPPHATFQEGGINCEMCHGPSLEHVERMKGGGRAGAGHRETPISFKRIPPRQYVAVCAQCHAQSAVHDAKTGGAVNYSDGESPFYRAYTTHLPSSFARKAFYRDGRYRATTFISEAFARSACFRKGGATCGSCHDPHPANTQNNPTSLKFAADSDQMCVQCHTELAARPERHTRHAAGTEASRCVSCHMPRNMEAVLFQARSHQIDEVPDAAMTQRFGNVDSPNACLGCHRDRGVPWLTEKMSALFSAR